MSDLYRHDGKATSWHTAVERADYAVRNWGMVPVEPDYESGVKTATRVMDELDNFEAAIVAGIAAALGR